MINFRLIHFEFMFFKKIHCSALCANFQLPASTKKNDFRETTQHVLLQQKMTSERQHNMFLQHQKVLAKHCAELVENESET